MPIPKIFRWEAELRRALVRRGFTAEQANCVQAYLLPNGRYKVSVIDIDADVCDRMTQTLMEAGLMMKPVKQPVPRVMLVEFSMRGGKSVN